MLKHYPKLKELWDKLSFKKKGAVMEVRPSLSAEEFKNELIKDIFKNSK